MQAIQQENITGFTCLHYFGNLSRFVRRWRSNFSLVSIIMDETKYYTIMFIVSTTIYYRRLATYNQSAGWK